MGLLHHLWWFTESEDKTRDNLIKRSQKEVRLLKRFGNLNCGQRSTVNDAMAKSVRVRSALANLNKTANS
jgi:hypothetical protein